MRRGVVGWLGAVTALALVLGACEASDHALEWRIRFETAELFARAEVIEARVVRGRCGDPSADVIYTALFTLADPVAPAPPRLGPGAYSIEAYGRDAACQVIAGDCVDRQLPSAERVVELVLQERVPVGACPTDEGCVGGLCDSEREPPRRDAATHDGGTADAATVDTGPPDAASPDAGLVCVPDATDGTGTECSDSGDCPTGFTCHRATIASGRGRCSRGCSAEDDCLPGWSCAVAGFFECSPSCPDTPICQCGPFFGFAEESACDGRDGDCDGRIDEAGAGMDVCGNGTCTCSVCNCDPGFTACAGTCADTSTDARHCGACGMACGPGFSCRDSTCVCTATMCGSECVNTANDESHCGSCGIACDAAARCCSGSCAVLASDPAHCGSCGNACAAGESCCGGSCSTTAC